MPSIQALRERRNTLAQEARKLLDDHVGEKWNAAIGEQVDAKYAEIDALDGQISRLQKQYDLEAEQKLAENAAERHDRHAPADDGSPKARLHSIFARWLRGGDQAVAAEDWAFIRNTMSTTTPGEGGYTVPTDVARTVYDALKLYGGVRAIATVIQTEAGNDINYPTSDGTSEVGELIGQNTTATGADPSFGVKTLSTYKYSSKIIAVPIELMQDNVVDMEAFIRKRIVDRIGRITNTHFTTGTGSGQPNGVVTAAGSGKVGTTGQTTTVIFDDLIDLVHSVDPAYRQSPKIAFMMNDASLKVVRKLKDSQGRPIFLPGYDGLAGPMADSLLGYKVVINQDVATMAANAKSILFGDFANYIVRDAMQLSLFRFTDSAYTKLGQVGFLAWARCGGQYVDVGNSLKYYANSAT